MNIAGEVHSVTLLTRRIKQLIEDGLPPLWVEGEISNYTLHRSKHRYFTLKDAGSQISCVMWRTRTNPGFAVKNGLRVKLFGRVTLWEQGGRYQFDVQSVMPVGMGSLQEQLEALKRKLADQGLFDQARKRALPRFPRAVGIVTSQTGAAVRDLVWGFFNRFPPIDLYLLPVAVQGQGAAKEIADAIETLNRLDFLDVIVVGRGGGSLEDLWAFNEEVVVRAVVGSRIPVVSAVGHEVDLTLCDLAADLRAPTPTAAAELVVPDRKELHLNLKEKARSISHSLARILSLRRERLKAIVQSYGFRRVTGRIADERLRLDGFARRLEAGLNRQMRFAERRLESMEQRLAVLSPESVLNRGFCVVKRLDGTVVRCGTELAVGDRIGMQFGQGRASALIQEVWSE